MLLRAAALETGGRTRGVSCGGSSAAHRPPLPPFPPLGRAPACRIEGALSYIVTHLSDISQLAAQTDRLDALLAALRQQAEGLPGGVHR